MTIKETGYLKIHGERNGDNKDTSLFLQEIHVELVIMLSLSLLTPSSDKIKVFNIC
jgi:hypothetical protein